MDFIIDTLRIAHIVAGFVSLIVFWIPAATKKGGKVHLVSGKWYVRLMWVVAVTAALLSIKNAWLGKFTMAAFLGFISLITANALWYGTAVLKNKRSVSPFFRRLRLAFSASIVAAALALVYYGITLGGKDSAVLLFIFGGLGFTEIPNLINQLRNPNRKLSWLKEHIVGLCSSGIAAYTAFFVFGGNQFFSAVLPGYWAVIPWVAPGIVGTFAIRYAVKRFAPVKVVKA